MLRTRLVPLLASLLLIPACSDDSTTPGAGGTGTTTSTSSAGGAGGAGGAGTTGSTSSTGSTGGSTSKSLEEQVSDKLESVRGTHDALQKLLLAMPKGADLHNHTSGAISMESLIKWGAEDGACIDTTTFYASAGPCKAGSVLISGALTDKAFYDSIVAAWSMEGWKGTLLDGHQHFFDAFGKYGAVQTSARADDMLAEVLSVAGKNKQVYIELMQGFGSGAAGSIADTLMAPGDTWTTAYLLEKRAEIVANPAFTTALLASQKSITDSIAGARTLLGCAGATPDPGCDVDVRMIVAANRTNTRAYVFGQWVFGYELAQVEPNVVGLNLVSPEENANSLAFYDDEMMAMGVLYDFNINGPGRLPVHFGLHAGELIPDVLPMTPEGQAQLTYHIRRAIEVAHAKRIGHGVDVLGETDGAGPNDLLADMAAMGVAVEICLTSNAQLLGATGDKHPVKKYMAANVPVAIATDDQGILRIDATHEYVRAVEEQGLTYSQIKKIARASLEHAFVGGDSLWKTADDFSERVTECSADKPESAPSATCAAFLTANDKARLQWKQEKNLVQFETTVAAP